MNQEGRRGTHHLDQLDDRALFELWAGFAELLERDETRVGRAEDTMAVAGDDLSALERLPQVGLERIVGNV